MINKLLKYLENKGRKYAFVDFYGDVQMYRYHLFYQEPHIPSRWFHYLPNVFIHVYPGEPDGESPHSHPYNTLGIIVRGGYTEVIDEKETRTTNAFGATFVSYKSFHRIESVQYGTMSIFIHGFRKRKEWLIQRLQCVSLCKECNDRGVTSCVKPKGVESFRSDIDLGKLNSGIITWIKVDDSFNDTVEKRKQTLKRMKVETPETTAEKKSVLKKSALNKLLGEK
jgi:hypothetical protein